MFAFGRVERAVVGFHQSFYDYDKGPQGFPGLYNGCDSLQGAD